MILSKALYRNVCRDRAWPVRILRSGGVTVYFRRSQMDSLRLSE